jgi:hypothetical protein
MSLETLQQANMFSGEWETKRTRSPLAQMSLFSINETFEFGARVRPWLAEAGRPTLELISEDARTSEEIERDLMREAEVLTSPMFASEVLQESGDELEREALDGKNGREQPEKPGGSVAVTQLSSYHALVNLAREQAVTLWVDGAYRRRYYNQLPLTIQAAQGAGLTASEISAALQIGEFLGNRERQVAGKHSGVIFEAETTDVSSPADTNQDVPAPRSPQSVTRSTRAHEGLRARLRCGDISVRTRRPKPEAPEMVPILWMEREHIQKRLPYLAEGISRLDEDELASLAESISAVLQEAYWTILGIALAHYLDHEQSERLA